MSKLSNLGPRFELAADTLHPQWRELLQFVELATERRYKGHPHDWVVHKRRGDPLPLASTRFRSLRHTVNGIPISRLSTFAKVSSTSLPGEIATLGGLAGDQSTLAKCVRRYSLSHPRTISVNASLTYMEQTLDSRTLSRFSRPRMGGTTALLLAA